MTLRINLERACLICLQESVDLRSIFDCEQDEISIESKIIKCFPGVQEIQHRPENICYACLDDLLVAYRFYTNCESSTLLLRCTVVEEVPAEKAYDELDQQDLQENTQSNALDMEPDYDHFTEVEKIEYDEEHLDDESEIAQDDHTSKLILNIAQSKNGNATVRISNEQQIPKRFKSKIKPESNYNRNEKTKKNLKENKNAPKICEICGNTFKYQYALKAHMRRHVNDRPFSCEFCRNRSFVSNVELSRHMRVHTGDKPYACQFCDRRFSDFGSRIKHERTHTGERPFVCTYVSNGRQCNKRFAYSHVLSVHLRTHTGEKKFKCSECGRGFTKKAYLVAHMRQHGQSDEIVEKEKELLTSFSTVEKDNTKKFECSECGEAFSKKTTLLTHMQLYCKNGGNVEENSEESLGDCLTAYIIEEVNDGREDEQIVGS